MSISQTKTNITSSQETLIRESMTAAMINRELNFFGNSPLLYLIATPIGNLGEMTPRALEVLKEIDYVACEDTRNSGSLLKKFGLDKQFISCHEHNEEEASQKIISLLKEGKKIEKGTELPITLQTPIDTSVTQENDEVAATLNKDLMVDGAVVAKKNSVLYGKVIKAKSASNCMRGGKVKIKFDKLVTTDNQIYSISTKAIDFVVSSDDKMATIGQTAIQVVIMALYGIATFGVGAVVIAACFFATPNGLLPVLTKKGTDAVIPAATPIEVSLDSSLNAVATY